MPKRENPGFSKLHTNLPELLVLLCILLMPLISPDGFIDPKYLPRGIFQNGLLILLSGILLVYTFREKNVFLPPKSYRILPFILLLTGYSVAALFAHNTVEALHWIQKNLLTTGLALTLLLLINLQSIRLSTISLAVSASVFIAMILFAMEYFPFDFQQNTIHSLKTPFGHKNLFASWLVLSIPFILNLIKHAKSNLYKGTLIAMVLIPAASIPVVLQAKTATAALGIFVVLLFILYVINLRRRKRVVVASLFLFLMITVFAIIVHSDAIRTTILTGSIHERVIVWKNTLHLIGENPILGVGGGNWQIEWTKFGLHDFFELNPRVYQGYETFQRPHNDYLWVFVEAGMIGGVGYLMLLAIPLYAFLKCKGWKKGWQSPENIILAGLISYFMISISDFSLERFEHQSIMVLLYLFSLPPLPQQKKSDHKPARKLLLPGLCLIMSLYILQAWVGRALEEQNHFQVLEAHAAGNYPLMLKLTDHHQDCRYNIDHFSIPVPWYRGVAQFSTGDFPHALHSFLQAWKINPYQIHVLNNLAGSYQQLGEPQKALTYYDQALHIAPLHYEVLLNKSITQLNHGDTTGSFQTLLALIYKKEHPPAYHHAMPVIFDAYLKTLQKDSVSNNYHPVSIQNLIQSDSLKIVLLYHYQIEGKPLDDLLNTFTMSIP